MVYAEQHEMLGERVDIRRAKLPSNTNFDYDPLEHRAPLNPLRPWLAYLHVVRSMLGPGVLFMPLAMSQAGIITGPLVLLMFAGLLIHTQLLLLNNLREISRRMSVPHVSYRYAFRLAVLHGPPLFHFIGNLGPVLISMFLFLSQMGICVVFIIVSANSLQDIMDFHTVTPAIAALLLPFIVIVTLMKNFHTASYFSILGNILNFVGFVMIISFSLYNITGRVLAFPRNTRNMFWAIGSFMFNLTAVAVILAIEKGSKHPQVMMGKTGVVTMGIAIPSIFSAAFGAIGYWAYGSIDGNILRQLPLDDNFTTYINFVYLVSLLLAYPTQSSPAISVIIEVIKYHDPDAMPSEKNLRKIRTFGRPLFVAVTFFITYLAPYTGAFVPFVGNLCTSLLAIICPTLMDICLRYPHNWGRCYIYLIKDLFIMGIGLLVWIFGIHYCWQYLYVLVISFYSPNHSQFY